MLGLLLCAFFSISANAKAIKVLNYNTWGVPFTAWDTWRFEAAMEKIEEMDPDVVVLSEVFTIKGKRHFKSSQYPYQVDGPRPSGRLVGSGLRILSKHPIVQFATLKYKACKGSDCFSRKGAALVTLSLPEDKKINIVATHLDATGRSARLSQLNQLRTFSEWYEDRNSPTIFAGDMNFSPNTPEYNFTVGQLSLNDSWLESHLPTEPGYTYDCKLNHYAREYSKKTGEKMIQKRLDYLFHRGSIHTVQTELKFNHDENLFSDHFGLMGVFEI